MDRAPPVTIAIPFFDEERRLADAIRSVLAQTERDFELLLIDDGSRDGSLEIARSFRDARIKVFSDGARQRLPARLNEIAKRARGELVARMDADDVCHPDRLRQQLAMLRENPEIDAVGTWIGLVDADGDVLGVTETASLPATPQAALERGILAHASMVARRKWLLSNPYDETLTRTEDRDLWCRTVVASRFGVVPRPLYVVRLEGGAGFVGDYVEAQRQNRAIFRKHGPRIVGRKRTLRLVAESHAKALVMRVAHATKTTRRVLQRRGRLPTADEQAMVLEALAAAQRA